jgi:hypothetical protein
VALLIAPLVVRFASDEPVRAVVAIGSFAVVAGAIWVSKRRRAEEMVEEEPPSPQAAAVTTEAGR